MHIKTLKSRLWGRCSAIVILCLTYFQGFAQFDPAGGKPGSQGVHRSDPALFKWADSLVYQGGYQNIADTTNGRVTTGTVNDTKGSADNRCLSLGDGGSVTAYFETPLINRPGYDFVVFENGFAWNGGFFLELAFVEVSSDGRNFQRFPAQYAGDTQNQIGNLAYMEPEWYHNLAGKHQAPFGTPFDLDSLPTNDSVDLDQIHFIRLIDVVGSLNDSFGSRDFYGKLINDPWPTDFPNSGFDLDAIGLLNGWPLYTENFDNSTNYKPIPNPLKLEDVGVYSGEWFGADGRSLPNGPNTTGIYWIRRSGFANVIIEKVCVIH